MASEYIISRNCSECYNYITDACPSSGFTLPTGLSDGTEISWEIEDKFGAKYKGNGIINSDEEIEIPVTGFPEGLFNAHAGIFIFKILGVNGNDDLCEGIDITICEEDYSCIAFSFTPITEISDETPLTGYGYGYTETE